jgi:hypothetical protein
MNNQMTPKEIWRQALISILIGAIISFLTVLFQGLLDLLKDLPAEVPGVLAGSGRYIIKWTSNLRA